MSENKTESQNRIRPKPVSRTFRFRRLQTECTGNVSVLSLPGIHGRKRAGQERFEKSWSPRLGLGFSNISEPDHGDKMRISDRPEPSSQFNIGHNLPMLMTKLIGHKYPLLTPLINQVQNLTIAVTGNQLFEQLIILILN